MHGATGDASIGGLAVLLFGLASLFADGTTMGLGEFLSSRWSERDVSPISNAPTRFELLSANGVAPADVSRPSDPRRRAAPVILRRQEDAMIDRRLFIAGAALGALPTAAAAHHGWRWTSNDDFTLAGTIRGVRLGNPHGLIEVEDAEAALWTAELGQPWRHEAAGLPDDRLAPGVEITLEGHRSSDPAELRMKAEQVVLGGVRYNLYPDRG